MIYAILNILIIVAVILLDPILWTICIASGLVIRRYLIALLIPMALAILWVTVGPPSESLSTPIGYKIVGWMLVVSLEVKLVQLIRNKTNKKGHGKGRENG